MNTSLSIDVHFATGANGHNRIRKGKKPKHAKPTRLPRITRLMALAIKYEHLFAKGIVKNQIELAGLLDVDESQISMVLRLRLLAPDIQEWILTLPEQEENNDPIFITDLRKLSRFDSWDEQRQELLNITGINFAS
jgi:hypothetical protein